MDHGFARFRMKLMVFAQSSVPIKPSERALDYPETRQDMNAQKAILVTKLKSQFLDDGSKGGFVVKFELSRKDHPSFILSSYLLIKF